MFPARWARTFPPESRGVSAGVPAAFPPESRAVSAGVQRGFRRVPVVFRRKAGAGLPRLPCAAVPMGPAPEPTAALFRAM